MTVKTDDRWVAVKITGREEQARELFTRFPEVVHLDGFALDGEIDAFWLRESNLATFLFDLWKGGKLPEGLSHGETASRMFDAILRFNQTAAEYQSTTSEELQELTRREREQQGVPADQPTISLRLLADPLPGLVTKGSVIALSQDATAMVAWVPDGLAIYADLLQQWAASFD